MIGEGVEAEHQIAKEMQNYLLKRKGFPQHKAHPEFHLWEGDIKQLQKLCVFLAGGPPAETAKKLKLKLIDDYFPEAKDFLEAVEGFLPKD